MAESNCEEKEKGPCPKRPFLEIQHMVDEVITILSSDIYRLHKHNSSMAKMYLLEEWTSVNEEHVNAWRTAHELKSNTTRLLRSRVLILDEDLPQFEAKINDIKVKAVKALADFQKLQRKLTSGESLPTTDNNPSGPSSLPNGADGSRRNRTVSEGASHPPDSMPNLARESHRLNRQVSEGASTERSYEHQSFYDMVQSASGNVGRYAIPVAGGVLGSMFLGPVGLAIGVKLGAAAAVGGGIAGIAGGKMIQSVNDEMQEGDQDSEDTGQVCKPLENPSNEEEKDAASCETTTDAEEANHGDIRVGPQDETPVRDSQAKSDLVLDPDVSPSKETVVPEGVSPSKETVVPEGVSPSKESVVPEGVSPSKESVVPEGVSPSKESVVPEGVSPSKESVVPEGVSPSKESVVPEGVSPSKESVVPEGVSSSKESVVPEDEAGPEVKYEQDNAHSPPAKDSEHASETTDPVLETRTAESCPATRPGDSKCDENINTHRADEQSQDARCPVAPPHTGQTENPSIDHLSLDPLPPDPIDDVENTSSCEAETETGAPSVPTTPGTRELDKPLPLVLPGEEGSSLGLETREGPGTQNVSVDTKAEDGEQADSELGGNSGFGVMKGISDFVEHPTKEKFAAVAIPLAAGVAGTALAGPVGFIAGTKLAALGAVTGGILGATTGTILQDASAESQQEEDESNQQQNEGNDHEMLEVQPSEPVRTLDSVESVNQQPAQNNTLVSADTAKEPVEFQVTFANKKADEEEALLEETVVDTETATQQISSHVIESPGQNTFAREGGDESKTKMGQAQLDSTTATVAVENPETESECTFKVSKDSVGASGLAKENEPSAATDEGTSTDTVIGGCPGGNEQTAQDDQQEEEGYFASKLSDFACFVENIDVKKAKMIAVPVLGGVIGSILAGPIGMVAGAKIGTVGAVGGGVLGMKFAETSITSQTEPSGDTSSGKMGGDETRQEKDSSHFCAEGEQSLSVYDEKKPSNPLADNVLSDEQAQHSSLAHSVAGAKPKEEPQLPPAKLKTD